MIITTGDPGTWGLHTKSVACSGVLSAPATSPSCPAQLNPRRQCPWPLRLQDQLPQASIHLPQTGTDRRPAGQTPAWDPTLHSQGTAVAVQSRTLTFQRDRGTTLPVTYRVSPHRVAKGPRWVAEGSVLPAGGSPSSIHYLLSLKRQHFWE